MLKECVKGLADACAFFDVPVVGGNVSLYNEHGDGAIDPTPVVSMIGLIDKQENVIRSQLELAGLELILLGGWPMELGGSYYLQTQHAKKEGAVPEVSLENEKKVQDLLIEQIEAGRIVAATKVTISRRFARFSPARMIPSRPNQGAIRAIRGRTSSTIISELICKPLRSACRKPAKRFRFD